MATENRPALVGPPKSIKRIGRVDSALRFSRISPEDNELRNAGNRYDVPGGGVLYGAVSEATCFAETVARFRPSPKMREILKEHCDDDGRFMVCGGIPQAWRLGRRVFTLRIQDALAFVDVEAAETLTYLEHALSGTLVALDYGDNLDLADIRNSDRRLSRAIATHFYAAQDVLGTPQYSGIRYKSRLDDRECWAVFEGCEMWIEDEKPIELDNPYLVALARRWDLRPF